MIKIAFLATLLCYVGLIVASPVIHEDYKKAIASQQQEIKQADRDSKGKLLKELAVLYLKDQNQERAFETFFEALDQASVKQEIQKSGCTELYQKALAVYFDHSENSPVAISEKIIQEFAPIVREQPQENLLAYLVAIAYANLGQYDEFFRYFYNAYLEDLHHFLVYKTKAILHIKLMERKKLEEDRQIQREAALQNLNKALEMESNDVTLYKLLITFSTGSKKQQQVERCLNKIIGENIIIPRSDLMFYMQEAVKFKDIALAQCFIAKARKWYQQSRILDAAENYLAEHEDKGTSSEN